MLGAAAAQRLGIDRVFSGERIWLDNMWFYVAGILNPAPLTPEIDSEVLVGFPAAEKYLNFDGHPSEIYLKVEPTSETAAVDSVLAATANPESPNEVDVSQPSAALVAQADAKAALNGLFLGLGAVALLVGAVGVANIMVISVLERRSRDRASPSARCDEGAHPHPVPLRGDPARVPRAVRSASGSASSRRRSTPRPSSWAVVIPPLAWGGGIGASIVIGAIAGLWPAIRAARLSPTEALWSV